MKFLNGLRRTIYMNYLYIKTNEGTRSNLNKLEIFGFRKERGKNLFTINGWMNETNRTEIKLT